MESPTEQKTQEERSEFYGDHDDEFNQEKSIGREVTQVNWDIPWSLSVKFSLQYKQTIKKDIVEESIVTNTNATGDLSLTKNWKVTYDVRFETENWTVNFARFGITRNLHCWEMTMDWTPTASRASYNFRISVRANVLKESMKYDKKSF